MNLPEEIEDYIKESIDHCLGLPVSEQTLELKLRASEEARRELQDQCLLLQSRLKEKDDQIELARGEASMTAQALKKFVEENQKLAAECVDLLAQCKKWEGECALYDKDREALIDFGNEADEKAKQAEARARHLEEEVLRLSDELRSYKRKLAAHEDGGPAERRVMEETLLESVLEMVNNGGFVSTNSFLDGGNESCQKLLNMWNFLRPATQKVLSLVAEAKKLEKDREHLRTNLSKAEEEAKMLFNENNILNDENQRLLRHYRRVVGSGVKSPGTASAKSNKRKSSTKVTSRADEKRLDFGDVEPVRAPLSPLKCNSPDNRMQKRITSRD
ncbi:uncharacterized protein LOC116215216 [Punica granatum]|uniref:Uncharacterized protein LOC116215216 n=1 Tax=Punica granatum TaxID=22663 RepID=A0A218X8F3_PUNGR|nr:uncharacterized protein LOC116215216 [Punica granatum]OWM80979.1 hypothetical protein CDL15_Pgr007010 [Punica granatum]